MLGGFVCVCVTKYSIPQIHLITQLFLSACIVIVKRKYKGFTYQDRNLVFIRPYS